MTKIEISKTRFEKDYETITEQIGMRIKYLRKLKKISQLKLSVILGINKNYICDLEKGRRNPNIKTIYKFCLFYGISLEEFFRGIISY